MSEPTEYHSVTEVNALDDNEIKSYFTALDELKFGKRLPSAIYTHSVGIDSLPDTLKELCQKLQNELGLDSDRHNLFRFHIQDPKIAFLSYPDFEDEPHPALQDSKVVSLDTGRVQSRDYTTYTNPPILHRKETFLPPHHPHVPRYAKLTRKEEEFGLYERPTTIGFSKQWQKLLREKNVAFDGHELISTSDQNEKMTSFDTIIIERHRTAIPRYEISRPLKTILEWDLLDGRSYFDYGCGLGDDIRCLINEGYDAHSWDPYFFPENELVESDVVNLGFVMNVIEDPQERHEVLRKSYELTKELLVVSVMHTAQQQGTPLRIFNDGIITNRNTFQKYYGQDELHQILKMELGIDPVPVSLGIFYIFKSDALQQDFFNRCSTRRVEMRTQRRAVAGGRVSTPRLTRYQRHYELLDWFWERCLILGRLPRKEDLGDKYDDVRKAAGSIPKAIEILRDVVNIEDLEKRRLERKEDMLVGACRSQFSKRVPFTRMSNSLKHDIKAFFGQYSKLEELAQKFLFDAGNPEKIREACINTPFGRYDKKFLQFHGSYIDKIPLLLRVYLECGGILYGNVHEADIIKIHIDSGKLSLMFYDDFDGKDHPELQLRVKLKLRGQSVDIFDYGNEEDIQLLYEKDSYVDETYPLFDQFVAVTDAERKAGLLNFKDYGPTKREWEGD